MTEKKLIDSSVPETTNATDKVNEDFNGVFGSNWTFPMDRIEHGRKCLEVIGSFLHGLLVLEETYANGLLKLSESLAAPETESDGVKNVINLLRVESSNRAKLSNDFANAVKSEIIEGTLLRTIENHRSAIGLMENDGIICAKKLDDAVSEFKEQAAKFDSACRIATRACLVAQNSEALVSNERTRHHTRALSMCVKAHQAEVLYGNSAKAVNECSKNYSEKCSLILSAMEDMDLKRIHCLKDSVTKLCIFRTSQLRNAQYDSTPLTEAVANLDNQSEIDSYKRICLERNVRKEFLQSVPKLSWPAITSADSKSYIEHVEGSGIVTGERYVSGGRERISANIISIISDLTPLDLKAPLKELKDTFTKEDGEAARSSRVSDSEIEDLIQGVTKWYDWGKQSFCVEKAPYYQKYQKLCDALWKGDFVTIFKEIPDVKMEFHKDFDQSLNRWLFCRAISEKLVNNNLVMASINSLCALTKIANALLDCSDKHTDYWAGRTIMVASQLLCANGSNDDDPRVLHSKWNWPTSEDEAKSMGEMCKAPSNPTVWTLHRGIYQHQLWNRVNFWESAFVMSLSEDQQKGVLSKLWEAGSSKSDVTSQESMFQLKNPCCKYFLSFGRCMVAFGIVESHALSLIKRVCERHCLGPETYEGLESLSNEK